MQRRAGLKKKEKDFLKKQKDSRMGSPKSPILGCIVNSVSDAFVVELRDRGQPRAATKSGGRELPIVRWTAVYGAHETGAAGRFL